MPDDCLYKALKKFSYLIQVILRFLLSKVTWNSILLSTGRPNSSFNNSSQEFLHESRSKVMFVHPWRCSRPGWIGPWATWSSKWGGWWPCPAAGLEIHDPWGPFQLRPFCDSVGLCCHTKYFGPLSMSILKEGAVSFKCLLWAKWTELFPQVQQLPCALFQVIP